MRWWAPMPQAGDILWYHFSSTGTPGPKPRPCLVIQVDDSTAPEYEVLVAYGTSQKVTSLSAGEFSIRRIRDAGAYDLAGLSYDTKFNLKELVWLPYNSEWFSVPPAAPHGQVPRLGVLHPSLVHAVEAAWRAAHDPG